MRAIGPVHALGRYPPSSSTVAMAAADRKVCAVLRIPKTGTLTKVHTYFTGNNGAGTIECGIYTVDSSGDPTATAYGGMTAGTESTTTYLRVIDFTLGTPATVTRGDVVAIVFSYSVYDAGSQYLVGLYDNVHNTGFPYASAFDGSTWTKSTSHRLSVGVEYDDGTYPLTPGFSTAVYAEFSLGPTQRHGNVITPTADVDLVGIAGVFQPYTNTYNYFVESVTGPVVAGSSREYTDPVRIQSHEFEAGVTTAATGYGLNMFQFLPAVRLSKDTSYVIGIEVTSGSDNHTQYVYTGQDSSFAWFEQAANASIANASWNGVDAYVSTDHDYQAICPILRPVQND